MNWLNDYIHNNNKLNDNFDIEKNTWPSEGEQNEFRNTLEEEKKHQRNLQEEESQSLTNQIHEIEKTKAESSKSYKEYTKIDNCKNDLHKIFRKKISKEQCIWEFSAVIMDMLTSRESYNHIINSSWSDLIKLKNKYKAQNDRYNKAIESTQNRVKENKMDRESNPAWYWIVTTPEIKTEWINYKSYTTIPIQNYNYIASILNLANRLRTIWLESNDTISVKIPNNFIWFLKHNDSIVIHFKKKENVEHIRNSIFERSNQNNIPVGDRELWRTTFAADGKSNNWEKKSFSSLISNNIAVWMYDMIQTKKYTEENIIEQWIHTAIQQSSKPPKIDWK